MVKTVTDVYNFEEIIGEGAFSNVVLATHNESQKQYAIKIIEKSKITNDVQRERIDREISILKMCNHPNIVKLVETFESDDEISLVMELMSGGDLFDRITTKGKFPENEARVAMQHILAAVDFLHDKSLVHRDLKPENLLYSSKESECVKVSDFGLSKYSLDNTDGLETPCGTIAYVAPEITHNKVYRKAVDIWSCGCIFYFMLFGRPPFYSEDESEVYDLVSDGIWSFPTNTRVSDKAKDLVKFLLEKDPNKRFTAKQALAHPFFMQNQPAIVTVTPAPQTSNPNPPTQSPSAPHTPIHLLSPPTQISPSQLHGTTPLAIPSIRASFNSAIDAQRGPLTPPLISPLESAIWKKRAKSRAMMNNAVHLAPLSFDDLEEDHGEQEQEEDEEKNEKRESDLKFSEDPLEMEMEF